jgi:hypothetical protein
MELENIIISKLSQVQKAKSCMFSLICGIYTNIDIVILHEKSPGHAKGWSHMRGGDKRRT